MSASHLALTLLVVVIWGINFVVMKVGLHGFPPLLLCSIRFFFVAVPAVFFLPRPKASWSLIAAFGIANFALQFGFMFTGIYIGMPPGLASLVLQTQVLFTMALAALVFGERPSRLKLIGAMVSFSGICVVGYYAQGAAILLGFILILLAGLSWSSGSILSKKIGSSSPLTLVVWGNLMAFPPILVLSLVIEGPGTIVSSFSSLQWSSVGAVCYIVILSTLFGYSVWGYLLNTYPAATVAPFSLLIPIVGFISSAVFLDEDLPVWKVGASFLVIVGLAVNVFESRIKRVFFR